MFPDPNPVTFVLATSTATIFAGATNQDFVCTGRGPTSSTYRYTISDSHFIDMTIGHQYGKRNRYTVRFTESELVADPINPSVNSLKTSTAYVVVDRSLLGAGTNQTKLLNALGVFLLTTTTEDASMVAVLNGET